MEIIGLNQMRVINFYNIIRLGHYYWNVFAFYRIFSAVKYIFVCLQMETDHQN